MKFLIQRVLEAKVDINNETVGRISKGFLVLIGIEESDTQLIADKMINKLIGLRIFDDEADKINLNLESVNGSLLLVSQFTLYADCRHGHRPSFINAAKPQMAETLYEYIIAECKKKVPVVQSGIFGADMKVSLINDGPFTIILDSKELF